MKTNKLTKEDLDRLRKKWYDINAPSGKECGYPECCIKAFCDQPPEYLERYRPTRDDVRRVKASVVDGRYSGFIPCIEHAEKILSGEISIYDLISNRNKYLPPFPFL